MARTLSELEATLDDSLAWRRAELLALETEVSRQERDAPNAPLTRALNRSGVALLYAHWEGYVKEACEAYLAFVAARRLRYDELSDGVAITALVALMHRVESGDDVAREALLDAVRRPAIARARVPRRGTVNTKANLRYDVLVELCSKLGLPDDDFITRRPLIDRSLCDQRNAIAHGKLYFPDADTFAALNGNVLVMLGQVRGLIVLHARESLYRYVPNENQP